MPVTAVPRGDTATAAQRRSGAGRSGTAGRDADATTAGAPLRAWMRSGAGRSATVAAAMREEGGERAGAELARPCGARLPRERAAKTKLGG